MRKRKKGAKHQSVTIQLKRIKPIKTEADLMQAMRTHFTEIGPKDTLTKEEIQSAYDAAVELLDISMNYECFGENAARAEDAFGKLITALQAD